MTPLRIGGTQSFKSAVERDKPYCLSGKGVNEIIIFCAHCAVSLGCRKVRARCSRLPPRSKSLFVSGPADFRARVVPGKRWQGRWE